MKPGVRRGEPRSATRPLRVLFVDSQSELGGAGFALLTLLEHLDRSEAAPVYASLADDQPEIWPRVEALGIPAFHVRAGRFREVGRSAKAIYGLRKLIRKEEIDVVLANSGHPLLYARPAAVGARRPCVWWVHGYVAAGGGGDEPIAKAQRMLSADGIYANSEFTAGLLARDFPNHPCIRVVRYGVDLERFRPDPEAGARVRQEAGIPAGEPVIGMFGRLQRWKGQHVFLRAAALLAGRGMRFTVAVVGGTMFGIEPEYAEELERLAAAPSLAGRVRFPGNVRNPQDWMNASDVVVHASIEPEPWGLVVAEGMACGRAVLAAAEGGPLEMIDHKRTGWLAAPGDEVALAAWLEILLKNPELRAELGTAARQHAVEAFDPRRAAGVMSSELWRIWAARIDSVQLLPEPVQ
ncbi:MAG TPA: glycosyltransferase family 4 protein [Candidatus Acidoferrales bacterium]|nr:glycosyltransferase family 4 protein [Candidatus Acidoferrales bacterium]